MKPFFSVLKKELKSYIDHPMAYVLAIVFLVINNFLFFRTSFAQEFASLRPMFSLLPWVLLFFVSALTMRTWAEERREHTLSVLLSYPVKVWQVILGKFLATSVFVSTILLLTLVIPMALSGAGQFDWGVIGAQYIGAIFMIVAMTAVGQWTSSLTKNQVVAFIISIAVLFAFFFVGLDFVVLALPFPLNQVAQQLGMLAHYNALIRGVVDVRDLLYFISVSFVFLALTYAWLTRMKIVRGAKEWRSLQTSISILIAIALVINLFGQSLTIRADLTDQKLYSLSSATRTVLRDLDDTVRLTLYRSKKLPTQIELVSRDVQDILSDYAKYGGRHIDLQIKYPDTDEEIATEAQQNGIPSIRFNVVREDEFTLQEGHLGLVIQYLDEKETLPFIQSIDDLEYQLTSNILALQTDAQVTVGYATGFGASSLEEWATFASALRENNTVRQIDLQPISEDEEEPVDVEPIEGIDVLIIPGPTEQLSDQAVEVVTTFADNGGKILWFVSGINIDQQSLSASNNTTGLESLLASQGVTIRQELVADLQSHETVNFSQGVFSYLLPYPYWIKAIATQHVLAGNIQQVTVPWSSSINATESEQVSALLTTTDSAVIENQSYSLNPDQLETLATKQKVKRVIGVTVQDIESTNADGDLGRWVVIANDGFLDENMVAQYPNNLALATNAIDWLAQNEALLSIRTKSSQPPVLIWESDGKQAWAKWGNIIGMPILIVLFGAFWIYRRKRKMKSA